MNELILIGAIAVFAGGWFLMSQVRKRPLPRCESCNAKGVIEINREPKATRHFTMQGSDEGGTTVQMQQDFEITYQCKSCHHEFSRLVTETNV